MNCAVLAVAGHVAESDPNGHGVVQWEEHESLHLGFCQSLLSDHRQPVKVSFFIHKTVIISIRGCF